ncbi:MAG: glycogen/starch synthase [Paludibacteraceae bacterium]|nr:glycogen/starch synthase [Paludibacteraceae bacterium]
MLQPDYIFETSWEVCNRVGGIYAVLSTRAASMQKEYPGRVFFFGPDWGDHSDIWFREKKNLIPGWKTPASVRVGIWDIPGQPIAILLRWEHLWPRKDEIYTWAWQNFGVRSHAAYGDYDESCLYGYACGQVMQSLHDHLTAHDKHHAAFAVHANEWQTAFSIFYMRAFCPDAATLFTTHATSIGRSIAGNNKPLYDYFHGYHGDQMAEELNMVSKHSAEKQAAFYADCFTTVSDITARECAQLLDKPVDIVTPNGFEPGFVPRGRAFEATRTEARQQLTRYAEEVLGGKVPENSLYCCIAGRQEWKNKGIDAFLLSMERLGDKIYHRRGGFKGDVIAFVMIPYLDKPVMRFGRVSVIFVPYYLDGNDPVFHRSYYDLLIGMDVTAFPSYYEPWGYTPLESIAFHVPTITTSLAGFGAWADKMQPIPSDLYAEGVRPVTVIRRNDSNTRQVEDEIAEAIFRFAEFPLPLRNELRKAAATLAHKAEWRYFFKYYRQAYHIALRKAAKR